MFCGYLIKAVDMMDVNYCMHVLFFRHVTRDVVFMIDTSYSIGSSSFQVVRELTENITVTLKVNSPKTLAIWSDQH